jgi:RNA polymerase sigma factor (TIGR02999 family)
MADSNQGDAQKEPAEEPGDLTELLRQAADGDKAAGDALAEAVYGRLEEVAEYQMRGRRGPHHGDLTLDPAGLVNDTLMKLLRSPRDYANRRHFYVFATRVMMRVLQDYQRSRRARKRGGHLFRVTLTRLASSAEEPTMDVDDLPPILEELEHFDQRKAEVVRLRVFFGLEMAEIAEMIGVSLPTVERDWRFARHWLATRLAAKQQA